MYLVSTLHALVIAKAGKICGRKKKKKTFGNIVYMKFEYITNVTNYIRSTEMKSQPHLHKIQQAESDATPF